ncbi:MAG: hypothetical protein JWM49_617 [Microbacteriaceae bacterium]|nr:hypothetical protein [Microbacteriaceae bacterium]
MVAVTLTRVLRLHPLFAVAALVAATVCGCSTAEPSPTPSASVKPSPTPTTMTESEAAAAYLSAVCPTNKLLSQLNEAVTKGDFPTAHALFPQLVAGEVSAAKALDAGRWPITVKADVKTIRDFYFASIVPDQQAAAATSLDEMNAIVYPDATASNAASQRARARLGLSPSQLVGC